MAQARSHRRHQWRPVSATHGPRRSAAPRAGGWVVTALAVMPAPARSWDAGWRPVLDTPTAVASEIRLVSKSETKRKSTPQSSVVPERVPFSPLFTANDVPDLAVAAGAGMVFNAEPEVIAGALCDAFSRGIFQAFRYPSSAELARRYYAVRDACREVLKALGYEDASLAPFLDGSSPTTLSLMLSDSVAFAHAVWGDASLDEVRRESIQNVGRVVKDLEMIANTTAAFRAGGPKGRRGDTKGDGLDALFESLAGIYFAAFGIKPVSGKTSEIGGASGTVWALALVDLAKSRWVEGRPHAKAQYRVFAKKLAELRQPLSVGKRMRTGWTSWLSLPAEDQWSPAIWHPRGTSEAGTWEPDWLVAAGIPVPLNSGAK